MNIAKNVANLPIPGNETREEARRAALRAVGFAVNFQRLPGTSPANAIKLWQHKARHVSLAGFKRIYPGIEALTLLYPRDAQPQDKTGREHANDRAAHTLPHLPLQAQPFGKLAHEACHWTGWKVAAETGQRAANELRQEAINDLIAQAAALSRTDDPLPHTVTLRSARCVPRIALKGNTHDVLVDPVTFLAAWRWVGGPAAIELRDEWLVLIGAEGHEAAFMWSRGGLTVATVHV